MLLHTNFSRAISSDFEETFTNYLFHKKSLRNAPMMLYFMNSISLPCMSFRVYYQYDFYDQLYL